MNNEEIETKSVEELLPIMGDAYKDLSVQVAFKEGYNAAVRLQTKACIDMLDKFVEFHNKFTAGHDPLLDQSLEQFKLSMEKEKHD